MTDAVAPQLPNEDEVLAFTHQQRLSMLGKVLKDGAVPEDPSMAKVAVSLLKDMDAMALGRKRIKADEKIADSQEAAAGLISRVLTAAAATRPYQLRNPSDVIARPAPQLGSEVPPPLLVEGETAVVSAPETYESFVARAAAMPGSATGQ